MRIGQINSRVLCPLAIKIASMQCIADPEDEMNDLYMAK
jgi:hypothetical protein